MFSGKRLPNFRVYLINEGLKLLLAITWFGVNVTLFYFTFMYYYSGPQFYYLHQMLGYGLCISRASAACINLNCSAILLPMCKRLITRCRGFNHCIGRQIRRLLDKSRSFHTYCGYLLCLLAAIHCGAHAYNSFYFSKYYNNKYKDLNVAKYANQNPLLMMVTTVAGITGLLLVVCLVVISVYASKPLRANRHDRFWKTHHLFIAFYALLFIHGLDGVIKYQTNVKDHRPGCFEQLEQSQLNSTALPVIPEPEPNPHHHGNIMAIKETPNDIDMKENKMAMKRKMSAAMHPEPEPLWRQHAIAEPEPMPEKHIENTNSSSLLLLVNGKWIEVVECKQPPPEFASCPREAWLWICIPLALYIFERILRYFFAANTDANIVAYQLHPEDVIELRLTKKSFKAKAGQSIWLRCPTISKIESHPFTLTSVPSKSNPTFGIHIKVLGDWTREFRDLVINSDWSLYRPSNSSQAKAISNDKNRNSKEDYIESCVLTGDGDRNVNKDYDTVSLYDNVCESSKDVATTVTTKENSNEYRSVNRCEQKKPTQHFPTIFVEGPTGSPMEDIFKYKVSVCFAGGIGITPFASVLNSLLLLDDTQTNWKLKQLHLIWACKDMKSFGWFATLINRLQEKLRRKNLPNLLNVSLYITIKSEEVDLENETPPIRHCKTHFGRPNIREVLCSTSKDHPRSTTIGVFCCGPCGLIHSVRESCFKATSCGKSKFVFSKESF